MSWVVSSTTRFPQNMVCSPFHMLPCTQQEILISEVAPGKTRPPRKSSLSSASPTIACSLHSLSGRPESSITNAIRYLRNFKFSNRRNTEAHAMTSTKLSSESISDSGFSQGGSWGGHQAQRSSAERRMCLRLPRPQNLTPGHCSGTAIYFNVKSVPGVRLRDVLYGGVLVDHSESIVFATSKRRHIYTAIHVSPPCRSPHYFSEMGCTYFG